MTQQEIAYLETQIVGVVPGDMTQLNPCVHTPVRAQDEAYQ